MAGEEPIALKEVQVRLGVPQHVLIHLCEKGVIEPEFGDTSGRGKRRQFSEQNVFEFAIALALRRLELPVATAAFVVRLSRSFARAMKKQVASFELPASLVETGVELGLSLYDDRQLVFHARGGTLRGSLLLGCNVPESPAPDVPPRLRKLTEPPGDFEARVEINLSQVARNLGERLPV